MMKLVDFRKVMVLLIFPLTKTTRTEEVKINDEVQSGISIVDLAARTSFMHERPDGKTTFQLLSGGPFNDYLFIDSNNGKLFARKKIDRDSLCAEIESCCKNENPCSIKISVAMVVKNSEPITREIHISIEDKNDHKPTFEPAVFNLSISESCKIATTFQLPLAIDKDSDIFSVKTYKLIAKNDESMFNLETPLVDNKITANLRLKSRLDREERDQYSLTIAAVDGGTPQLTGTLVVFITITDVNDNPPMFDNVRYSVTVNESQISNDPIIKLVATDSDLGENAEVFYKLDSAMSSVGASDVFRIDLRMGTISMIAPLDYEKQTNYKLIVTASNRQMGVGTATTTVTVNVVNINDEKPIIFVDYLNNLQHAQILENEATPKFVSIVSVTDKDIGMAGKVTCRLDNEHEQFDLRSSGPDQYKVHTRQKLDREIKSRYALSVVCQDQGSPSLSATVIIPVSIIDENDNRPEINSPSTFHISENMPIGTVITTIEAVDKDDGINGKLEYSISDVDNRNTAYLKMELHTGILRTTQIIDREATSPPLSKFDLTLTVMDCGSTRLSAVKALHIIVDDENDNAPQFAQSVFRFTITENEVQVYRLGQIDVSDPDEVGTIQLTISSSKLSYRKWPFTLISEKNVWWLMTSESLNWEEQQSHEFIIVATDGPGYKSHTTSTTVQITVLDVNDNAPVFIFPRLGNKTTHVVSYRQQPGFVLLTVSAADKDNPENGNGKFYFSILADPGHLVNIDSNLGRIQINRQMTPSDIGDHYVDIRVEDQGTPSLSSELRIKIRVTDSTVHFNEKGSEYDNSKHDPPDFSGSIFSDRESIFVFGLVLILLIVVICICFVVYLRHIKGWLVFLPDLISMCQIKEDITVAKEENLVPENAPHQNTPIKYCSNSNYYSHRFMTSPPPNFSRTPDIFIKNGRDCYEVLKCPQDMQHDLCQIQNIHEQQYNDLVASPILPPFQDNYLTLHQYPPMDYPLIKDTTNNQSFSKFSKMNLPQGMSSTIPLTSPEKSTSPSFTSSKASYAVSFPTEQSTFV